MNVVQPIALPGKPKAATLGLVDVDIHPRTTSLEVFKPYLSQRWWEHLQTWGMRARHGFTGGQPPFPKAQPLAARRDAWPPTGGTPASDLDFLRFQLLDNYGIDYGILNPLQPSGQGDRNNGFSAAMAHANNEWQLDHWLRKEPRLRGSIVVPYEDPIASAAEIRKRAGDPNFSQVLMMSRTAEPAGNPRYWPIYEAAVEAGLPVAFHAFGYSGWAMTNGGWPSFYIEEVSEHATSCQNQVISLVTEGVFEQVPRPQGGADRMRLRLAALGRLAARQALEAPEVRGSAPDPAALRDHQGPHLRLDPADGGSGAGQAPAGYLRMGRLGPHPVRIGLPALGLRRPARGTAWADPGRETRRHLRRQREKALQLLN